MTYDELDREHGITVDTVADFHGVDPYKLWEMYLVIMERNFFQDLHDIARENLDELKGE